MSKIEEVAKYVIENGPWGKPINDKDAFSKKFAKGMIEIMREPTEEMLAVGAELTYREHYLAVYQLTIDAALKE